MVSKLAGKLQTLLFVIFALTTFAAHSATIITSVDRDVIAEDETLTFTLRVQSAKAAQPDWQPLEKEFDIVSTSQNNSINIINGSINSSTEWQILLSPKHLGELSIPSLQIGKDRTEPMLIKVIKGRQQDSTKAGAKNVFMEVSAQPEKAYVQSQVLYTIRIYYAVPIKNATLEFPTFDQALIERVGEDTSYETKRNGKNYRVTERRYAIFPQHSGKLTLPVLRFRGQIQDTQNQRDAANPLAADLFDSFFAVTRPINLKTSPITLEVRPMPLTNKGEWLPAENVTLSESWQPPSLTFKDGEPITRTVTIKARGLSAAQLPEINLPAVPNIKIYPGKVTTENIIETDKIVGTRSQQFTYVPTKSGDVTLPEVSISWWDAVRDKQQTASLDARTLKVQSSARGNNSTSSNNITLTTESKKSNTPDSNQVVAPTSSSHDVKKEIFGGLSWNFAIIILVAIAAMLVVKRILFAAIPQTFLNKRKVIKNINQACKRNNTTATRDALMALARLTWPNSPPNTLVEFAKLLNNEQATTELQQLDRILYAKSPFDQWDGMRFWHLIYPILKTKKDTTTSINDSTPKLPDLYSA